MTLGRTRAALAGAAILAAPPLVWTADLVAGTPPIILAAAVAATMLAAAAIVFVQRGAGRSVASLGFAFLWGAAGAAFLSSNGNELARECLDVDAENVRTLIALVVAPALEEGAKAAGLVAILLLARRLLRDARDGVVYGALIGVGFTFTENLLYLGISLLQGGEGGLVRALYLRGIVGTATHVVFTAGVGAAVGRYVEGASARLPLAAFVAAVVQHAAWNGLSAPWIARVLCGASESGAACRDAPDALAFLQASAIALVFLLPGTWLVRAIPKIAAHAGLATPNARR